MVYIEHEQRSRRIASRTPEYVSKMIKEIESCGGLFSDRILEKHDAEVTSQGWAIHAVKYVSINNGLVQYKDGPDYKGSSTVWDNIEIDFGSGIKYVYPNLS